MRTERVSILAATVLVLQAVAGFAQGPGQPPPAAPQAPTPPAAGETQKTTADALAQEAESKPKEPEEKDAEKKKRLTGRVAAGLTLTQGNSNTRSFNLSLGLEYHARPKNLFKADGFYIRSTEEGVSSVDRTSAHLRDEQTLSGRAFAYGDFQFLKDRFKSIDSLIAVTVGAGYRLVKTPEQELSVDLGAGAVGERDEGLDRTTSGAVRAGENYLWKISKTANLTESAFVLWKTRDT